MSITKITEKEVADTLPSSSHILFTYSQVGDSGDLVEVLRRAPISMLYQALYDKWVEENKENLVAEVTEQVLAALKEKS
jgi:hypothetical protein